MGALFDQLTVVDHQNLVGFADGAEAMGAKLRPTMHAAGLQDFASAKSMTYPSRLPLAQLDFVYARGLVPTGLEVPRGRIWWRMSDHLPLIAEFRFED